MYTNKQIWNVSYPIFLSLLAQNVINVTDTAFLGRVGEVNWAHRRWAVCSISVPLRLLSVSVPGRRLSWPGAMESGITGKSGR